MNRPNHRPTHPLRAPAPVVVGSAEDRFRAAADIADAAMDVARVPHHEDPQDAIDTLIAVVERAEQIGVRHPSIGLDLMGLESSFCFAERAQTIARNAIVMMNAIEKEIAR